MQLLICRDTNIVQKKLQLVSGDWWKNLNWVKRSTEPTQHDGSVSTLPNQTYQ